MTDTTPRFPRWMIAVTAGFALAVGSLLVARFRRPSQPRIAPALPPENPRPSTGKDTRLTLPASEILPSKPPLPAVEMTPTITLPTHVRWLIFVVVFAVCFIVLTGQVTTLSMLVFVALVVGSALLAYVTMPKSSNAQFFRTLALRIDYNRDTISQGGAWLAVGFMIISAVLLRYIDPERPVGLAVVALLLGGMCLVVAGYFGKEKLPALPAMTKAFVAAFQINWRVLLPGVVGMLLLSEISGRLLNPGLLMNVSLTVQFLLLVISAALIVWGLSGVKWPRLRFKLDWQEIWPLAVILVVALVLRLWASGTTIRTLIDELHFMTGVKDIWAFSDIGMFRPMTGLSPFPWLYPYWQSWTVGLFGRTLFGFRAASAFIGVFNILALYLLARTLFDRRTAVLSALVMTAFPPHLHFSRVGIIQIADPMFATFGFALLARGLKHNRRVDYALGGVGIGMSQYFYEAGRLLFPPLALLWLAAVSVLSQGGFRQFIRSRWRGLVIAGAAFILLTIPVYYTLVAMGHPLTGRLNASGLNSTFWAKLVAPEDQEITLQNYLSHLAGPFLLLVRFPESDIYYGGAEPLILVFVVPVFLLGVGYALWRVRSPGMLLALLWVAAAAFGNSLLVGSMVSSRYLVVFPALALLIAIGLRCVVPLLWPGRTKPMAVYVTALALAVVLGIGQVIYYFGPHLAYYQMQSRLDYYGNPRKDIEDAVLRSVNFPPNTYIHVIGDHPIPNGGYGAAMLDFLVDGLYLDGLTPAELTDDYLARLRCGVDHAFFIEPEDSETLRILRDHFILEGPQISPYDMPLGTQYVLYYAAYSLNFDRLGRGACS